MTNLIDSRIVGNPEVTCKRAPGSRFNGLRVFERTESYLLAAGFKTGWLFEDIQENSLEIESVALPRRPA